MGQILKYHLPSIKGEIRGSEGSNREGATHPQWLCLAYAPQILWLLILRAVMAASYLLLAPVHFCDIDQRSGVQGTAVGSLSHTISDRILKEKMNWSQGMFACSSLVGQLPSFCVVSETTVNLLSFPSYGPGIMLDFPGGNNELG